MPIRPENKARYPKDWPAISKRIRERSGGRCEHHINGYNHQTGFANGWNLAIEKVEGIIQAALAKVYEAAEKAVRDV